MNYYTLMGSMLTLALTSAVFAAENKTGELTAREIRENPSIQPGTYRLDGVEGSKNMKSDGVAIAGSLNLKANAAVYSNVIQLNPNEVAVRCYYRKIDGHYFVRFETKRAVIEDFAASDEKECKTQTELYTKQFAEFAREKACITFDRGSPISKLASVPAGGAKTIEGVGAVRQVTREKKPCKTVTFAEPLGITVDKQAQEIRALKEKLSACQQQAGSVTTNPVKNLHETVTDVVDDSKNSKAPAAE